MSNTAINGRPITTGMILRATTFVFGLIAAVLGVVAWTRIAYASNDRVDGIDKRLGRIEDKLDRLLERGR